MKEFKRPTIRIFVGKCERCGAWSPISPDMLDDFCGLCGEFLPGATDFYTEGEIHGTDELNEARLFALEKVDYLANLLANHVI